MYLNIGAEDLVPKLELGQIKNLQNSTSVHIIPNTWQTFQKCFLAPNTRSEEVCHLQTHELVPFSPANDSLTTISSTSLLHFKKTVLLFTVYRTFQRPICDNSWNFCIFPLPLHPDIDSDPQTTLTRQSTLPQIQHTPFTRSHDCKHFLPNIYQLTLYYNSLQG